MNKSMIQINQRLKKKSFNKVGDLTVPMEILDILILGSGPAALCLASELAKQNLNIKGLSLIHI